ncbi:hypothetical protein [Paenibacillus ehimensis]|uniref:Uncharacterized protein n=1 Tax=Paenibacillus ehimensis TaxID=79264 RepID=A0ABT8V666_9BACL|nr:hypothetical protein [Paenibacillus ehimensis]MDO3676918.1 hypothetical protein [Paenibacillus ehimensis]MEC0208719.1 hypothetical protein [Paenibacillus ehimensis]
MFTRQEEGRQEEKAYSEGDRMLKLIGSMTEQYYRDQLIKFNRSLFQDHSMKRLLGIVQHAFPDMKTAYILGVTPDQGEDIYTILINSDCITCIELDRYNLDTEPIIETVPIKDYKRGLSKIGQIQLAVAMDLAEKRLNH